MDLPKDFTGLPILSVRIVPWDAQYGVAITHKGGKCSAYFVGDIRAAEAEKERLKKLGILLVSRRRLSGVPRWRHGSAQPFAAGHPVELGARWEGLPLATWPADKRGLQRAKTANREDRGGDQFIAGTCSWGQLIRRQGEPQAARRGVLVEMLSVRAAASSAMPTRCRYTISHPFQPVNRRMQVTITDRTRPFGTTAVTPSV